MLLPVVSVTLEFFRMSFPLFNFLNLFVTLQILLEQLPTCFIPTYISMQYAHIKGSDAIKSELFRMIPLD